MTLGATPGSLFRSVAFLLCFSTALAEEPGAFRRVATLHGRGGLVATTVAPGPAETELLYASYLYYGDTFEVISVDPTTGRVRVFQNPVEGQFGARCMAAGPDGNVYLGTLPNAHLLRLEPSRGTITDLGRPSQSEEYVWDCTFAQDGRLYGATYPGAKLIRFDPKSGRLEDLGRMDDGEMYARYVAADDRGFVYVGIGMRRSNIVAFNTATGEHRSIFSADSQVSGQARVFRGVDGKAYGVVGTWQFRLDGWDATKIEQAAPQTPAARRRDGRVLTLEGDRVTEWDPLSGRRTSIEHSYAGRELPLFRIGTGPDGKVYGSSIVPSALVRLDESRGELDVLGEVGPGEVYAFLAGRGVLLMAGYACSAPLMSYDPMRPFQRADSGKPNPTMITFAGMDSSWRPLALTWGNDGRAYAGAVGGYGRQAGLLVSWDVDHGTVQSFTTAFRDQGVASIAAWNNLLLVGTTTQGGGGTQPSRREASVIAIDPSKGGAALWALVPIPGAPAIESLVALPSNLAYGIAGGKVFLLDPSVPKVVLVKDLLSAGGTVHGALGLGRDGRLWGLASGSNGGVFSIDPSTNLVSPVVHSPRPVTGGFAITEHGVLFTSGADLFQFSFPAPTP